MSNRVLIIGPSFFYYNQSIARAFKELGYETNIVQFDEPIHPFNLKNALVHKFAPNKEKIKSNCDIKFNAFICKVFESYSPDLVFIYNGDILFPETISFFKKTSKVAIWLLDGLYRHPKSERLAPLVDAYFCFEQEDTNKLKRQKSINAQFLPQACDTSIYHPLKGIKKDIDILFVGTLYGYPKRIELLKRVVEECPEYNIQIYGRYKPFSKNPVQWLTREHRHIYKNKNISPKEINLLYNKSKICLNIHHEQSKSGANPKVFEISGSNAFQLADWNPYIEHIFPNHEVGLFHSEEEMIKLIRYYLEIDTTPLTEEAYNIIREHHTFKNRIYEALQFI